MTSFTEEDRIAMAMESATVTIRELRRKLDIALETMNKLTILQSGSLDYTQDFFEICKTSLREALERIENEQ